MSPVRSLQVPILSDEGNALHETERKILDTLNSLPKVIFACPMAPDDIEEAFSIEENGVRSAGFENLALTESKKRTHHIFVLCTSVFDPAPHHQMVMMNEEREIVGFFTESFRRNEYTEEDGYIWVSDNLVLTPKMMRVSKVHSVSMPQNLTVIGEKEGAERPIMFLPSLETDLFLRKHYCISAPPGTMTSVVSYDIAE